MSLNGRPIFCPRATARARPSPVRAFKLDFVSGESGAVGRRDFG